MKAFFKLLTLSIVLTAFITSCESNDEICQGVSCPDGEILNETTCECQYDPKENEVIVEGNITSDVQWTSDKIYVLTTRVIVESGATLDIQAGTIIKGLAGAEANSTALIIARGAKINANGTATSPIIFTSVADQIQPGEIVSPNLADNVSGLWGGVVILGNAPISADAAAVQIEGIPPSDQNGLYGGANPNDNSGVLRFVSIRHGGTDIGEGNEINGLTLGGVGSETVVENVEVVSNVDDGIEFFGGTVNATNCIVWNQGDDAYDADQAWSGTLDNFIYIAGSISDHGLELDGPEGAADGQFTLKNGTLKGAEGEKVEYADLRAGVACNLENLYFLDFNSKADLEIDNNGVAQRYLDGDINFINLQFNVSHLSDGNTTMDKIIVEKVNTDEAGNPTENLLDIFTQRPLDASNITVTASEKTVGANVENFRGWTLADARGNLNGL